MRVSRALPAEIPLQEQGDARKLGAPRRETVPPVPNPTPLTGYQRRCQVRKGLEIGGIVAAVVLIVFGVVSIAMGIDGRDTVTTSIERENIVGTPDMTPSAIKAEEKEAGLTDVELPSCDVANQPIDDGDSARCFASYMRVHALEATGGYTYAEMGQFEAKPNTPRGELSPGGGTSNEQFAATDPETGQPAENGERSVWVTETALSTALNASYM